MCVGGALVTSGQLQLSDFVAFFLYIGLFMKPLLRLTAFTEIYQRGMAGYNRVHELMQQQPDLQTARMLWSAAASKVILF